MKLAPLVRQGVYPTHQNCVWERLVRLGDASIIPCEPVAAPLLLQHTLQERQLHALVPQPPDVSQQKLVGADLLKMETRTGSPLSRGRAVGVRGARACLGGAAWGTGARCGGRDTG